MNTTIRLAGAMFAATLAITACTKADKVSDATADAAQPVAASATASADAVASTGDAGAEDELIFKRVVDTVPPGNTSVVNGIPVKSADWPTLLVAGIKKTLPDKSVVNLVCTATLIGPKVMLTAAHCVDGGASKKINRVKIDLGPVMVSADCQMDPTYAAAALPATSTPRNSADYALCLLSTDLQGISELQSLRYEAVDRDTAPSKFKAALVTGYGCTKIELDSQCKAIFGPAGDILRAGNGVVSGYPSPGAELNYIRTRSKSANEAALCPGDSGGPLIAGATLQNQLASRRVIGVNSSIAIANCKPDDLTSRFSATGTAQFKSFSDTWIKANADPIFCGVNKKAGEFPCRA